jgi:glycosyltransferase involved in cell wall biosynthesis
MKILLISPWENRWIKYMKNWFEGRGHELQWAQTPKPVAFLRWADIVVCGWANEHAIQLSQNPELKFIPYVCFVRSYEIFSGLVKQINWDTIDHAVFVNPDFERLARAAGVALTDTPCTFIPNAIDLNEWPQQVHEGGHKLAFVADLSHKKGLPLLAQVFMELPDEYELYLAGRKYETDRRFVDSFFHVLTKTNCIDRVHDCGYVDNLQDWLQDKDYILNTSPMEGCPNNVLEGMALGIKPIVFNWPGAVELFGHQHVFSTVMEARNMITADEYDSVGYRRFVSTLYSPDAIYGRLEKILQDCLVKAVQTTGAYCEAD